MWPSFWEVEGEARENILPLVLTLYIWQVAFDIRTRFFLRAVFASSRLIAVIVNTYLKYVYERKDGHSHYIIEAYKTRVVRYNIK